MNYIYFDDLLFAMKYFYIPGKYKPDQLIFSIIMFNFTAEALDKGPVHLFVLKITAALSVFKIAIHLYII